MLGLECITVIVKGGLVPESWWFFLSFQIPFSGVSALFFQTLPAIQSRVKPCHEEKNTRLIMTYSTTEILMPTIRCCDDKTISRNLEILYRCLLWSYATVSHESYFTNWHDSLHDRRPGQSMRMSLLSLFSWRAVSINHRILRQSWLCWQAEFKIFSKMCMLSNQIRTVLELWSNLFHHVRVLSFGNEKMAGKVLFRGKDMQNWWERKPNQNVRWNFGNSLYGSLPVRIYFVRVTCK